MKFLVHKLKEADDYDIPAVPALVAMTAEISATSGSSSFGTNTRTHTSWVPSSSLTV